LFPGNKKNINSRIDNYHNFADEELIAEYFSNHEPNIIGELFKRYTHLVFGVCLKYLQNEEKSKDAVMEIFESLIEKLKIHKVLSFKSWLYSVSKNHCLMLIRVNSSDTRLKEKIYQNLISENVELQDQMHLLFKDEQEPVAEKLDEAINQLKKEQMNCIKLMYLDDKSYKQIVDITGYSMKEVKSHLQNGKRNIKNYLTDLDDKTK